MLLLGRGGVEVLVRRWLGEGRLYGQGAKQVLKGHYVSYE